MDHLISIFLHQVFADAPKYVNTVTLETLAT